MHRFWCLCVVVSPLLGGCASIVNGQNQSCSVTTPGCPGASCELSNDKGKWYVSSTPASVTVNRSYSDLFVKCTKGSSPPAEASVSSKTKGMAFGNILLGGIIGAGVDVANGAAYDYPNEISLPMTCSSAPAGESGPVRLGCTVKELANVKEGEAVLPSGVTGVYVTLVDKGGLAEKSGILPGDVLTEYDDEPITGVQMLTEVLSRQSRQKAFRIRYFRGGQQHLAEFNPSGENL